MNNLIKFIASLRMGIKNTWLVSKYHLFSGNLVDVISADCGYLPLDINQTMIVHFDDKEYFVQRNK